MMMMMMLLGLMFVGSLQPMFMVMMLIMLVLLYSYMVYVVMGGYWFSYALVMVMLSGVLVVFTYMVSLIPNESFENYNLLYMMLFMMVVVGGSFVFMYFEKYSELSLGLWSSYFSVFNLFMVSFLLSIMLVVVWFSYVGMGALRSM